MDNTLLFIIVVVNFIIQLRYFHVPSKTLYVSKRVTTPLLHVAAILSVALSGGSLFSFPVLILLMMAIGEIGIEGSSVVESGTDQPKPSVTVLLSGILFLLVNLLLGGYLLFGGKVLIPLLIGSALVTLLLLLIFKVNQVPKQMVFQVVLYGAGIAVLSSGAISSLSRAVSPLGLAAAILSLSDSLVLYRMAAGWDKDIAIQRRALEIFLILILVLYYLFIAMMASSAVI